MTPVRDRIDAALRGIEAEHGVRVLYAVESGSRAWGFASPDSDWDVRFVYARPARDYLKVEPPRDVIELSMVDDLDVSGWDLFKALALFRKSNPPLLEWLRSPIVYHEFGDFAARLRDLSAGISPRRLTYHYLSLARGNWEKYIVDRDTVTLKKYLYVVRPLLCVRYLKTHSGPPPTAMHDVLDAVALPGDVRGALLDLVARKQKAGELGTGPRDDTLNAFLAGEIERVAACVAGLPDPAMDAAPLDALAWETLGV